PVDVTAQFFNDLSLVPKFTKLMLERGNYDALIGFWTSVPGSPTLSPRLLKYLSQAMEGQMNKLFIQSLVAPDEIRKDYETEGFPCFEDPSRAVAAAAALIEFGIAFDAGRPIAPVVPKVDALPYGSLSERSAKETFEKFGIPISVDILATTPDEAAAAAKAAGRPVALKIASADIGHKTDVGGVQLNVDGEDAARRAFRDVFDRCRKAKPEAKIEGILVAPMAEDGIDCILGAKIDPVFGAVIMFGLGGVFAEVLKDVSFRKAPVSPSVAREMIDSLKGAALLRGARGGRPADLEALCEAISRLSVFAAAHADELESAEINPLRALPKGCIGLDALIIKKR
ncbi:MAG: acetate--CoA ligase family protein, partial [Hyphomicrobiaceae bacterium]